MKKIALASTALASLSLATAPRAVHAAPRADVSDPKQLLAELKTSFEEFKKANDENLKAKVDDVILNEKIEKIDASMNEITSALEKAQADLAAAKLGGTPGDMQPTDPEYVQAFNAHFRKGDVSAALSVGRSGISSELKYMQKHQRVRVAFVRVRGQLSVVLYVYGPVQVRGNLCAGS